MEQRQLKAQPDPDQLSVHLSLGLNSTCKLFVTIRDLYGRIVENTLLQLPAEIDISHLHSGSYFIETIESREVKRASFEVKRQ